LNPFFHLHRSGNLTMNGLWYACLGVIQSHPPTWKMGSNCMFWDSVPWQKFVNLGFHCWLHLSVHIPAWSSASTITLRGGSPKKTPNATVGWCCPHCTCSSQTGYSL
jgi:hypothetical protein